MCGPHSSGATNACREGRPIIALGVSNDPHVVGQETTWASDSDNIFHEQKRETFLMKLQNIHAQHLMFSKTH